MAYELPSVTRIAGHTREQPFCKTQDFLGLIRNIGRSLYEPHYLASGCLVAEFARNKGTFFSETCKAALAIVARRAWYFVTRGKMNHTRLLGFTHRACKETRHELR